MSYMRNRQLAAKIIWQSQTILRNHYYGNNKYNIPELQRVNINLENLKLIAADRLQSKSKINRSKFVHFFVRDQCLETYYNQPNRHLKQLAFYSGVLTPDFSVYRDMPIALQIMSTFKNRWCGALWQECGMVVIPTITWGTEDSYDFCFEGVPQGSIVAISNVGVLKHQKDKKYFLQGYFEMIKRLKPEHVICYGHGYAEMGNEVLLVPYDHKGGRN